MSRGTKLLLPATLAVTVLGAGCGKTAPPPPPPTVIDAVAATPDAAPPDAAPPDASRPDAWERPDYPIG